MVRVDQKAKEGMHDKNDKHDDDTVDSVREKVVSKYISGISATTAHLSIYDLYPFLLLLLQRNG